MFIGSLNFVKGQAYNSFMDFYDLLILSNYYLILYDRSSGESYITFLNPVFYQLRVSRKYKPRNEATAIQYSLALGIHNSQYSYMCPLSLYLYTSSLPLTFRRGGVSSLQKNSIIVNWLYLVLKSHIPVLVRMHPHKKILLFLF